MMLINEYMKYYKVINFSAVWSGRHYHKLNGQMVSFHLLFIKLQYLQEKKARPDNMQNKDIHSTHMQSIRFMHVPSKANTTQDLQIMQVNGFEFQFIA